MVQARYAAAITFDAKPITEIATVMAGTKGVAGGGGKDEKPKEREDRGEAEEERLRPRRLSSLSKGKQAESTQASASAGNRAVGTDRAAKGGPNPSKLACRRSRRLNSKRSRRASPARRPR